jgi:hypothetical protein
MKFLFVFPFRFFFVNFYKYEYNTSLVKIAGLELHFLYGKISFYLHRLEYGCQYTVVQLVEALSYEYKPEGRRLNSR